MTMKLKLDEHGHVVLSDGKPVYVHDDGKEIPFDAAGTVATISRLNAEAKSHREAKEAAEKRLKDFDGIEDAEAARHAMATVKNLDAKKLVDAGEVEKVRAEAIKAVEEKYAPIVKKAETLEDQLYSEKIGGAFSRSQLIVGEKAKVAIPADMVQARFGQHFKVENGEVVAYDTSGNKLFSRAKPGEVAGFDEALEMLIEQYPHRDHILKSSGAQGSGASGSGGASGGVRNVTRAQFSAMDPAAQAATAKAVREGTAALTD